MRTCVELLSGTAGVAQRLLIAAVAIIVFLPAPRQSHAESMLNACMGKQMSMAAPLGIACQDANSACQTAIRSAELRYRLPAGLLSAIGRIESGRQSLITHDTQPWPWTIQAQGEGLFFDSKLEAIHWVQQAMQRGVRSIDTGCMQVNLMYHPQAFISLDQAFDPEANVDYAARFLLRLYASTQNWQQAIGYYHSHTPILAAEYQQRIARANTIKVLLPAKLSIIAQLSQAWRATLPVDQADPRTFPQ
jgi:hypothetical protein